MYFKDENNPNEATGNGHDSDKMYLEMERKNSKILLVLFFFNTSKYSKISYFTWKGRENPEINKGRVQFTVMKLKKVQRLT